MRKEENELFPGIFLPQIEFSSDQTRVKRGESVALRWSVKEAEEAILWKSTVLPSAPEPLDWMRISQLGEKVELTGKLELTPEETTAYYLVAKAPLGLRGERTLVEVVVEEERKLKPEIWKPQKRFLDRMEERSHVGWIGRSARPAPSVIASQIELALKMAEQWFAPPTPPGITISANPEVIFENESSTLSWNVSNANCVDMSKVHDKTGMVADSTKISGTKIYGCSHGSGGGPPCYVSVGPGSGNFDGKAHGPSHIVTYITAHNAFGKSAVKSQWVDILSIPQFKGASTTKRISDIKNAIKTNDKNLRNGCIYNNTALDKTVAAFKNGHLSRKGVWARLLTELQNIGLVTFNCQDIKDDNKWVAGHWFNYTNEILLEWSPGHTPYLEYVILHELVHKCGFNSGLYKFGYPKETKPPNETGIENQAHLVSEACYP